MQWHKDHQVKHLQSLCRDAINHMLSPCDFLIPRFVQEGNINIACFWLFWIPIYHAARASGFSLRCADSWVLPCALACFSHISEEGVVRLTLTNGGQSKPNGAVKWSSTHYPGPSKVMPFWSFLRDACVYALQFRFKSLPKIWVCFFKIWGKTIIYRFGHVHWNWAGLHFSAFCAELCSFPITFATGMRCRNQTYQTCSNQPFVLGTLCYILKRSQKYS